jgi:hypothetical protein
MNEAATLVAPFWTMLSPPDNSHNVFYQETGTAPNRELVVEWRDVNVCDNQNDIAFGQCFLDSQARFQVVFFESKSVVLFNYSSVVFGGQAAFADFGSSATIGIQTGVSSADQFGFNVPTLDNNTALLWTTTGPDVRGLPPSVKSLSPPSTGVGTPPLVTINGSNFTGESVVRWNGVDRATTFVNSGQLTIQTTSGDVASAGSANVAVFTFAGGISNAATFNILSTPQITSLGSKSVSAGGFRFTLVVFGSNFDSGSVVQWNGAARPTTFVTSTNLNSTINASDVASAGNAEISVVTGAGLSSPGVNLTITDFSLTQTGSDSVNAGQTATFVVSLQPSPVGFSFDNPVTLSCEVPSTAGSCSFTASQLIPGAAGEQTSLSIKTNAGTAALFPSGSFPGTAGLRFLLLTVLFTLIFAARSSRGSGLRLAPAAALFILCTFLLSCGGGNAALSQPIAPPPPTPTTVVVSITAASGSVQHALSFNLTVH